MTNNLKITVLGTGTSVGIPALGKLGGASVIHLILRTKDKDVPC